MQCGVFSYSVENNWDGRIKKKLRMMYKKWNNKILNIAFGICCIIAVLLLLQLFVFTSFHIPSDSMQPALLPGDCILVEKCSGGARLFNVLDAVERKDIDIYRMPAWKSYKRNDLLVFNFPYQPQRWDSIVFDVMSYYVKRCIALPGDTLEIERGYYRIRGLQEQVGSSLAQKKISALPDSGRTDIVMDSYPWNKELGWTIKEFGPLPVPAKGQIVRMDSLTWLLYRQLISWEQKKSLVLNEEGQVLLGDSLISDYSFCENYYFVGGDNALYSQDSRYWGLLPEPFIVGRVWLVWKSVNPNTEKIRWERIFKRIK